MVDLSLRTLLRLKKQAGLRELRGKIEWQGDLDGMMLCIDTLLYQGVTFRLRKRVEQATGP